MKETLMDLDFFGKPGSISRIQVLKKEDDLVDCYLKYEYDVRGREKQPQIVPKRQYGKLLDNYYQDLKLWLEREYPEYIENKRKICKKKINLVHSIIDAVVSYSLALISFVLSCISSHVFGIGEVTVLGVVIFAVTGVYGTVKGKEILDYQKEQNILAFNRKYREREINLNEYNLKKAKQNQKNATRYQTISREKSNGNTLKKTKVLEK